MSAKEWMRWGTLSSALAKPEMKGKLQFQSLKQKNPKPPSKENSTHTHDDGGGDGGGDDKADSGRQ